MRRTVLAIVITLFGVTVVGPRSTMANGATSIAVSDNNSRFVSITVTRQPTLAQYILVCTVGATECTPQNAENSNKVIRFDCYRTTQTTPTPCGDQNSLGNPTLDYHPASYVPDFLKWRPNSPSNYSYLPAGTYNLKVFESSDGTSFTEVANQQFSFPQYSYTYDKAPTISGERIVGATLTVTASQWTPSPSLVTYMWLRCKKATDGYLDFEQVDPRPYTIGSRGETADCLILNQDGTIREPRVELVSLQSQSQEGFTSYKLTDADLGSYIALHIVPQDESGLNRTYVIGSTSVVEKKTVPVNQTTPTATFTKTKKFKKLTVGAQVSATTGTWKWANTTTYQWFACTKRQKSATSIDTKQCKSIKRATKANYKVKKSDRGRFLVAQVTAANELGSTVIYATSLKKIS